MSHLPRLLKIVLVMARYRLDQIGGLRGPARLLRPLFAVLGLPWAGQAIRQQSAAARLKAALQDLGPIYIKFGQLLSTRRDFLPNGIADELQSLQDQVPGFTNPDIHTLVSQALDGPWQAHFATLETTPLASASVAQVHAATLHTGEAVVVKVLRPGIERIIRDDIRLLHWVARLVERHVPGGQRLRAQEVVADYERVILDELDLLAEGANATQLRRNFEDSPQLYVPRVYWDVSRRNMLVMERIYGIPVSDVDQLLAHNIKLKALAETGVQIFFTQVFEHSFFHADMHPGNIFVDPDSADNPRYIAIDCAIIGSLSRDDQQYLARNLLAIFRRDYRKVAELHVECGWVPRHTRIPEFEGAMRTVCEPIFEKPLKDISFGHLLVQLFRTASRFDMEVQPSLVLLQKTLLNVEGLGRQLYPELDLWQTALPFLEAWNRRRMQPRHLYRALKDNVPDWIEQLPELPERTLQALNQHQHVKRMDQRLEQLIAERNTRRQQRQRRNRIGGALLLGAALLSAYPDIAEQWQHWPLPSLLLAAAGVYVLYFRR